MVEKIGNIFEIRLFLHFLMVVSSPLWMNMAIGGALMVEQMMNIFDEIAYLYSNIY